MNIFLADEHFPTSSTYLLRNAGYDVTAIVEDGVAYLTQKLWRVQF
jgi:hypothetical protein